MTSNVLPVPLGAYTDQHDALSKQTDRPNTTGLPTDNPTKSFWQTEVLGYPASNEGSESALTSDADVCIIGSGITGVSAAYHLAKHFATHGTPSKPIKAVILEAREFCKYKPIISGTFIGMLILEPLTGNGATGNVRTSPT